MLSEIVSHSNGNLLDGMLSSGKISQIAFIQARKEIWGKVMFLHVFVHLFKGGVCTQGESWWYAFYCKGFLYFDNVFHFIFNFKKCG